MKHNKLTSLKNWTGSYISSFYCDDDFINSKIKLKHIHTMKVTEIIHWLADKIGLDNEHLELAEALGLLHDIGRFEQIKRYRTFSDKDSISHAMLGLEVIRENNILEDISIFKQQVLLAGVKHHSDMFVTLEEGLPVITDLYVRMIRDADKIDIYRVIEETNKLLGNPENKEHLVTLGITEDELTDDFSQEVLDSVILRKQADYTKVHTLTDRKLLQLCWIYDINFTYSLKRVVDDGYVQLFFDILPKNDDLLRAKISVRDYIEQKIPGLSDKLIIN